MFCWRPSLTQSVLLVALSLAGPGCRHKVETTKPINAVDFILEAFERYPVVALDEGDHQSQQSHEFIADLIRDPRFPKTVDDIVVEFATARFQETLDAYVLGSDVPENDLRQVWRETTQLLTWDSPVYQRFFEIVRAVNVSLAVGDRLRVLGGDPPIDWGKVDTHQEAMRFSDRDGHFAEVVEQEVIARERRGLIIAGGGHLYRADPDCCNVVQILEKRHAGKVFAIKVHDPESREVEAMVSDWPRPAMALLKGTPLGQINAGLVIPRFQGKDKLLEDVADAYLYIVPFNAMTKSRPSPEVYEDDDYTREVERRYEVIFQEPFPKEVWQQLKRHE